MPSQREYELQGITANEYAQVHVWLKDNLIKPKCCQHCKREGWVDNALINGKRYERNVDNYIGLCRSCHIKYDIKYKKERGIYRHHSALRPRVKKRQEPPKKEPTIYDWFAEVERKIAASEERHKRIIAEIEKSEKIIAEHIAILKRA